MVELTSIPFSECLLVVDSKKSKSPLASPCSKAPGSAEMSCDGVISLGLSVFLISEDILHQAIEPD